jgi:hypothetical protein
MTPTSVARLIERLSQVPSVSQFDQPGEPQSATLAHSLTDLEESFRAVVEVLLPKLLDNSLSPDQLNNVLLDIGEELRHVLYHIRDPKFFAYLFDREG